MKYNKEILFGDDSKSRLIKGVNILSDAVTSTFGGAGRTVIIEDMYGNASVTKDGVSVAKSIKLEDNVENIGCTIIKESAEKTVNNCGDGTTSTILLAQFLINEGELLIKQGYKPFEVQRGVLAAQEAVLAILKERSKDVTNETLKDVATISANNDVELGTIIADAFISVGGNGSVTIEDSKTDKTHTTSVQGLEVLRGYDNRYFITNEQKETAVLDNPLVLLVDSKIQKPAEIEPFLEYAVQNNRSILIVGEMDEDVLAMLLLNKVKGGMKVCSIKPPSFGYKRVALMEDLAIATGSTLIDHRLGDNFQNFDFGFLGNATKVIIDKATTTIMTAEEFTDDMEAQIELLKTLVKDEVLTDDKGFLNERIAKLAGKVAVIHVGGRTEVEMKERKDRVDDAVNATKASLEQGISPGGGVGLYDISFCDIVPIRKNKDFNAGVLLLRRSLIQPLTKILENAGLDVVEIKNVILNDYGDSCGYDVKEDRYGNMFDMGIVDPTKVLKHSLRNAVSVAMTIMTTNCTITNINR